MDINAETLVDNLLQGMGGESREDLQVKDETMISKIMGGSSAPEDREDKVRWDGFCTDLKWDKPLPISRAALNFIWSCIMGLVFATYNVLEWTAFKLTGHRKNFRQSIRANSVILFSGMMTMLTTIVVMAIFFIKDILLFPADNHVNDYGTVTMAQPCGVEHNVLLVNCAEFWAESGIRVVKGDIVRIAASGAFYGNMVDFHQSAQSNKARKYAPDNFHWTKDKKTDGGNDVVSLCVYGRNGEDDARYGSLLYQIKPEDKLADYRNTDSRSTIFQIEPEARKPFEFKAMQSGVLCFAVNDIYLKDRELIEEMIEKDINSYRLYKEDSIKNKKPLLAIATIEKILDGDKVNQRKKDSLVHEIATSNILMWYDDNIGEILLNVNVERKDPGNLFSFLSRPFRWIFHHKGWQWIMGIWLLLMAADMAAGMIVRRKRA